VIRPFDRIQRRAHRFHFLALMERARLPELMRNVSSLQCMHVCPAHIRTERYELPEENRDMPRFDWNEAAGAFGISNLPAAFTNQPIDISRNAIRQAALNGSFGDIAFSI